MPRRYLKRINHPKKSDRTENEFEGEKDPEIELLSVLQDQERKLTFDKNLQKNKEMKAVKEGTRYALDAAGNTGLYLKFMNLQLRRQISHINQIRKLKDKFDDEIETLQSELLEQREQIDKVKKEFSSKKIHSKKKKNLSKKA